MSSYWSFLQQRLNHFKVSVVFCNLLEISDFIIHSVVHVRGHLEPVNSLFLIRLHDENEAEPMTSLLEPHRELMSISSKFHTSVK